MSKIKILNDLINNYEYNNYINKNKIIDLLDYIRDLQNENNSLDYALKFQKEQCQYHVQDLMLKIDQANNVNSIFEYSQIDL